MRLHDYLRRVGIETAGAPSLQPNAEALHRLQGLMDRRDFMRLALRN